MGKKVLVAMDYSENSMRAVLFVSETFSKDHDVTLFSVLPNLAAACELEGGGVTPYFATQKNAFCEVEEQKRQLVQTAVAKGKDALVECGFQPEHVHMKIEPQKEGVARDIIHEAEAGYDVVVMGRKGLSAFKEFFLGSVSQKVLQGIKNLPILLVG